MTVLTFLAFLPAWLKFYAVPGPLRFVGHLLWRRVMAACHWAHAQLVLQGGSYAKAAAAAKHILNLTACHTAVRARRPQAPSWMLC